MALKATVQLFATKMRRAEGEAHLTGGLRFFLCGAIVAAIGFAQSTPLPPATPGPPPKEMVPLASKHPVVYLWPNGAPGSEKNVNQPEKYRIAGSPQAASDDVLVISSVSRPSITLFLPPKQIATGAAVVVAPGGAFRELWITDEGYRVGEWLSARGIAAFILKYRLPREKGSTYTIEGDSLADMQRAIRTVKSHASEWGLDSERVGAMGFSAGGMLAGLAGARFDEPVKHPVDGVDQLSARPAFQALIYGTPFLGPMVLQTKVPKDAPPTFLLCGGDDPVSAKYPEVYKIFKEAGIPIELHIYSGMGHGFAIQGSTPSAVASWPDRLRDWLFDSGFLTTHK
jgi:acetyl esterase/lipase